MEYVEITPETTASEKKKEPIVVQKKIVF